MSDVHIELELMTIANILKREAEQILLSNSSELKKKNLISVQNGIIINYLYKNRNKDICQRDIEKYFGLASSTVSTNLRLMEKKGLVKREYMTHDIRLKKVMLTEKSLEFQEKIEKHINIIEERIKKALTREEQDLFIQLLAKVKKEFI